jgi:hypothetical protein
MSLRHLTLTGLSCSPKPREIGCQRRSAPVQTVVKLAKALDVPVSALVANLDAEDDT